MLLILTPKPFAWIVLERIANIEHWFYIQFTHTLLNFRVSMNRSSVEEKVNSFISHCTADGLKHFNERFMGERVVCLMHSKYTMTLANSNANCLTRLILSPVFYKQVVVRNRPSFSLKISRLK